MLPGLKRPVVIQTGNCFAIHEAKLHSTSFVWPFILASKTKGHPLRWPVCIIRHLASFPQSSIIAATRLDFCVRNGNRYFPGAMDTEKRH